MYLCKKIFACTISKCIPAHTETFNPLTIFTSSFVREISRYLYIDIQIGFEETGEILQVSVKANICKD